MPDARICQCQKTQKQETGMLKKQGIERTATLSKSTGIAALVAALAACAPTAEVFYSESKAPDVKGDTTFEYRLATSTIAIGIAKKDKIPDGASLGGVAFDTIDLSERTVTFNGTGWVEGQTPVTLVAYVAPSPSPKHRVFLEPVDSLWKTVTFAPSYRQNSLLLKEVAIDTKDNRKDVIETVGAIAVGVVKVATTFALLRKMDPPQVPPTLKLPIILTLDDLRGAQTEKTIRDASGVKYVSSFPAAAADPASALKNEVTGGGARRALFTSECREGVLSFQDGEDKIFAKFNLTVADPSTVRTIPLPAKGKIELDPLCGGNTTIEQATRSTGKELAETLFAQIEQLRKAFSP
jgi:hypothetical protein